MSELTHLSIGQSWLNPGDDDGTRTVVVDLGPEHPSSTGMLLADARLDGNLLREVRIQPGFNHRSVEKLFEVRDYRQILVLADRHDWQAPFTGELAVALACEQLMGLVAPTRAVWLRTLLAEHARISSHLAHLTFVAHRTDDLPLQADVRSQREQARRLLLAGTGNRVHPMMNRLGGLALDLTPALLVEFSAWASTASELATGITGRVVETGLGQGKAIIDGAMADQYGLGGPTAIAAGIYDDLRITGQYLAYPGLQQELTLPGGPFTPDAQGRFLVLCAQIHQSAAIIASCVERLRNIDGPVDTKLSKIIKIPDSSGHLEIEAPWGRAGITVVSRAERTPWRLALRTPSFVNVQALQAVLDGCPLEDADIAIASLGWTSGDLDK